jgi:hypothetical protein
MSQDLYLQRTTQHRNTKTNVHASGRIRTHDQRNEVVKTYALDCMPTGTGDLTGQQKIINLSYFIKIEPDYW